MKGYHGIIIIEKYNKMVQEAQKNINKAAI